MDEVYSALEKLENGADLVAKAKAEVAKVADAEAKQRIAERSLKAFEGVDAAEAKALKSFADANGGVSGIAEKMGKAEQAEAEKANLAKSLEEHGRILDAEKQRNETSQKEIARLSLENKIQPFFVKEFNAGENVMKIAIDSGMIYETEKGLEVNINGVKRPYDETAIEEVKRHSSLNWALKTPSGGGEGGGVNGNRNVPNTNDKNWFDV